MDRQNVSLGPRLLGINVYALSFPHVQHRRRLRFDVLTVGAARSRW